MPRYPTPGEYQEAVQFPRVAFRDPELQSAEPTGTVLGLPRAITGAFAAVFPMRGRSRRWAVKCFLTEVADQRLRYRAVSRHLKEHPLPYFAGFDYQAEGIQVDGRRLPILKMAWIDGTPLNRFVEAHLEAPERLASLAEAWAVLLADLEAAELAHGDLQHGNVLVVREGSADRLRLVDYDTVYVPALKGRRSPEIGHRNYQHPDRDEDDAGLFVDRFAGLVIYTALQACVHRPDLWARYDTGENLLFRASDLYDPDASPLFEELARVEAVAPLVEALRTACFLEPEAVPPLSAVREGTAPTRRTIRTRGERPARRPRREGLERYFLPAAAAAVIAAATLAVAGAAYAGLGVLAASTAAGAWAALRRWRRLPNVRRRRRLMQEVAYFDRMIDRLSAQHADRVDQRTAFVHRRTAFADERLRELRAEALYDRLKYHFVGEAAAHEGITHKVVVRLKVAGIRTAYQATPDRLEEVRGIREASRARVASWRAGLVARYEDELPTTLSPAERRRLERIAAHRLSELDAEAARLKEKIEVQRRAREEVRRRLDDVPDVPFRRYLAVLLRVGSLPEAASPRPAPPPAPTPEPFRPAEPPAAPASEERPWWRERL